MKELKGNPFRKGSKCWVFCEICNLNYVNGFSDIIYLEELTKHNLRTINGGDWCRSDGPLGKYFNVNRIKKKARIIGVQLVGYKKNVFNNYIKKGILNFYKNLFCRVLYITGKYIEVDHKDGRKDDFGLLEEQKKEDFQPLHKTVNDAKRQHCKECKRVDIRFDAKKLGYKVSQWIGPLEYKGSCIGCFWYDPAEFNSQVSSNFKKKN